MRYTKINMVCICGLICLNACVTPTDNAEIDSAVYEQCLTESQAIAMAWEAIEMQCRKRAAEDQEALSLTP